MPNLKDDILAAAGGQKIEAVVIGPRDYRHSIDVDPPPMGGRIMSWDEASPVLDYEYDDSHGGPDCHDFTVWTATLVLFRHEYDGSTYVTCVPRHPEPLGPGA